MKECEFGAIELDWGDGVSVRCARCHPPPLRTLAGGALEWFALLGLFSRGGVVGEGHVSLPAAVGTSIRHSSTRDVSAFKQGALESGMHLRLGLQLIIGDIEVSVLREARQGQGTCGMMTRGRREFCEDLRGILRVLRRVQIRMDNALVLFLACVGLGHSCGTDSDKIIRKASR